MFILCLGTVVKKRGRLLGELLHAGDQLIVAYGGKGGLGVLQKSQQKRSTKRKEMRKQWVSADCSTGPTGIQVTDQPWAAERQTTLVNQLRRELHCFWMNSLVEFNYFSQKLST